MGVDTLDLNMGAHGSHAYKTHYVIAYLHVIIRLLVSADQLSCLSHSAASKVPVCKLNSPSADCHESKEWRHKMVSGPWPGEARVRSKSRAAQFDMDASYQTRHCAAQT